MMRRKILLFLLALWPAQLHAAGIRLGSEALGNVFVVGETVTVSVQSDRPTISWQLRDFFGSDIASGSLNTGGKRADLPLPLASPGYYTFKASSADGSTAETAIAVIPKARPPAQNSPFGVMTHFAKGWPTDIIPLIGKAGIHRIRDEQPWRKIEKSRGSYIFPAAFVSYMDALKAHHIDPLLVLAFSNPLYDNDRTPFSDEGRLAFAAYAAAVANRYRDGVSALEIWNEYNGSFCNGPCKADRPAYYAQMLKPTYESLKAAEPSLTVAGAAAVPIPIDYFRGLFKAGALDNLDAVVIHPYRKVPEGVEDKIAQLRALMRKYGKEKPIWATEYGDLADMQKSRDDVARYLVRMTALLLSANVERVYWYLLKDYREFDGLGLVRSENDPMGRYAANPAYVAYATLIHELDGTRFVRREASSPKARIYLFSNGRDYIRVAWSTDGPMQVRLKLEGPAQEVNMMGDSHALPAAAAGGITLDRDPVYLVTKTAS